MICRYNSYCCNIYSLIFSYWNFWKMYNPGIWIRHTLPGGSRSFEYGSTWKYKRINLLTYLIIRISEVGKNVVKTVQLNKEFCCCCNLTDPNSWYYLLSPLKICIEIIPLSYLTDFKSVWIYILCSSANTFNTFNLNWEDFTWNWLRSNYSIHMVVI